MSDEITYQIKVNRPGSHSAHYIGVQLPEGATKAEIDSEARRKLQTAGWNTHGFTFTVTRTMGEPVDKPVPMADLPRLSEEIIERARQYAEETKDEPGDSGELFTDSCS